MKLHETLKKKVFKYGTSTLIAVIAMAPMQTLAYTESQVSNINNQMKVESVLNFKENQKVPVMLNGQQTNMKSEAYVNGGRTLLPVRGIAELLNAKVDFQPKGEVGLVQITKGNDEVLLQIGRNKMMSNGKMSQIDNSNSKIGAATFKGATYLPLRAVADALGVQVAYENGRVNIITADKINKEKPIYVNGEKLDEPCAVYWENPYVPVRKVVEKMGDKYEGLDSYNRDSLVTLSDGTVIKIENAMKDLKVGNKSYPVALSKYVDEDGELDLSPVLNNKEIYVPIETIARYFKYQVSTSEDGKLFIGTKPTAEQLKAAETPVVPPVSPNSVNATNDTNTIKYKIETDVDRKIAKLVSDYGFISDSKGSAFYSERGLPYRNAADFKIAITEDNRTCLTLTHWNENIRPRGKAVFALFVPDGANELCKIIDNFVKTNDVKPINEKTYTWGKQKVEMIYWEGSSRLSITIYNLK